MSRGGGRNRISDGLEAVELTNDERKRAALCVAPWAHDVADARYLLEALGLLPA
jgi:hypothetical protein